MADYDPLQDLPTVSGAPVSLAPGQRIGPASRYELVAEAGRGGMGVVWRARDLQLDARPVALKFLPQLLALDELAVQDLKREATAMLDLAHPGIVRLHTLESDGRLLFLVMEYLGGPTLRGVLAARTRTGRGLSPPEARWVLAQVAPALDYAHQRRVLHRDLKPANLLLTAPAGEPLGSQGEELKLVDFGIAYVASTSFTQLTGRSHTSGTLPYMAPEVLLGRAPSAASDVYALGVTLYELVAGHLPFTHGDISRQITDAPPPPLESGDAALDAAVAAALAKDPAERPGSAGELLAVSAEAGARPVGRTQDRRGGRRRPLAWLAGAALLAAAGWAGWRLTAQAAGEPPAEPPIEHAAAAAAPPPAPVAPPAEEVAPAAVPTPATLSEPAANTLTNADHLPVRGSVAAPGTSAVWLQIEGKPESRKKVSVGRDGQFELAVFRLPQTDGSYFLEILAEDETLLLQSPLRVDRTLPALADSPRFMPEGPFRSGDGIAVDLEFDERVVHAGSASTAAPSSSLHWSAAAPPTAAADPEEIPLTLEVSDEAGNVARIEVAVLVFDPRARLARHAAARPDRSPEWAALDKEARPGAVEAWMAGVRGDALLLESERRSLVEDDACQRLLGTVSREAREAAAKLNPLGWEVLDATPGPKTGAARKLKDPQTGIVFILVEPGEFLMGSPTSEPERASDETQHRVTLTKAFYLGETEVTQAQWQRVMSSNPSYFKGDTLPVEMVSWEDCQEFCRKAGAGYRLPTEAEWEYACRAGSGTRFCFGDDEGKLGEFAWYSSNSGDQVHTVGQREPNAWGFKDMHGNVWEWCQDRFGAYPSGSVVDPTGATSGSCVLRGGSWRHRPGYCRSASRIGYAPSNRGHYLGLRVARTP